eukprot:TRINITY_DN3103_c0_g1_i1.p2 TRINITY_DN3103_c0_g1~~TRINITY_DN3103_c0_g1_i1.p2  ORF type:complete len:172 (+),score=39.35 TRINITY_DN3103_c0_g1_i1:2131-2646(+)
MATKAISDTSPSVSKLAQSLRGSIRLGPPPSLRKAKLEAQASAESDTPRSEDEVNTDSQPGEDAPAIEAVKPRRDSALAANGIDISRELKIETRRKELNLKHGGQNQLQKHVDTLRKSQKKKTPKEPMNELEARLQRQQQRVEQKVEEETKEANVSELDRVFKKRVAPTAT